MSKDFADTFADPAVIRGKDGWWYSYGTSDPLREVSSSPKANAQGPEGRATMDESAAGADTVRLGGLLVERF